MTEDLISKAKAAKAAARVLARTSTDQKNRAIRSMARALEEDRRRVLSSNHEDTVRAEESLARGELSRQAVGRLALSEEKLKQMARGLETVAGLCDPVGRVDLRTLLDDGLELRRVTCPFGVLAAIVEARPDAVVQLAALAIKSGNAMLIKAGSEAMRTTEAILTALRGALRETGVPEEALGHIAGRQEVKTLLTLNEYIDLVIPRGSKELVRYVQMNSTIPVLGHADGVCHIYVDASAEIQTALSVILDSKVQSPIACNSVETVLVHADLVPKFLLAMLEQLVAKGVLVRGCERTRALGTGYRIEAVEDWHTEYGDLVIAVRLVDTVQEAIEHINCFGSGHTDAIITQDLAAAQRFMDEVDSAGVYLNASTRFSDGYRYGFGAEVGISTNKLHARGPVGLDGLVTYKYKLYGHGHLVADYVTGRRRFKHEHQMREAG